MQLSSSLGRHHQLAPMNVPLTENSVMIMMKTKMGKEGFCLHKRLWQWAWRSPPHAGLFGAGWSGEDPQREKPKAGKKCCLETNWLSWLSSVLSEFDFLQLNVEENTILFLLLYIVVIEYPCASTKNVWFISIMICSSLRTDSVSIQEKRERDGNCVHSGFKEGYSLLRQSRLFGLRWI